LDLLPKEHIENPRETDGDPSEIPLVSVVVPTFDRPELLARALTSIQEQTLDSIEIIVVNDGGCGVESVVEKRDGGSNISYVRHDRNRGLAASRNTGIKMARGKYIAYLDDDDLFYPQHLETLFTFLETSDFRVAYTDAYAAVQEKINGQWKTKTRHLVYSRDFDDQMILVENYIPVLCLMHERSCTKEVGLFDEEFSVHEDWEYWIRLSRSFRFHHISKATSEYSQRHDDDTQMNFSRKKAYFETTRTIFERYGSFVADNAVLKAAQQKSLASRRFMAFCQDQRVAKRLVAFVREISVSLQSGEVEKAKAIYQERRGEFDFELPELNQLDALIYKLQ
jgi:glycosyltransferase involved in cell wall biosynthesis